MLDSLKSVLIPWSESVAPTRRSYVTTMGDVIPEGNVRRGPIQGPVDDPLRTLSRFDAACRAKYECLAQRWIRRVRIDQITLSSQDAIQEAWLRLCARMVDGRIEPIHELVQFERSFGLLLWNVILDERRRQHARKRACQGDGKNTRQTRCAAIDEAGFDRIDASAPRADESVSAGDELQASLDALGRRRGVLRAVALRKMQGHTNAEIAAQLNVSIWAIQRILREMRKILVPRVHEDR